MSNEYFHEKLGILWSNFQSLDAVIRTFLHRLPKATPTGVPYGTDIYSLPVGTELPESPIANMMYFSSLVDSYNKEVVAQKLGAPLDVSLIELRNALAHGFVSADASEGPMRLLNFKRVRSGFVKITVNEVMDLAWFRTQSRRVFKSIHTVHAAVQNLPKVRPPVKEIL
jgi:hypothetical protein